MGGGKQGAPEANLASIKECGASRLALSGKAFADRGRKIGYTYYRTRFQALAKQETVTTDKVRLLAATPEHGSAGRVVTRAYAFETLTH